DRDTSYPLAAWSAQFDRIRADLDDALRRQEDVSVARRTPEQREVLGVAFTQFWDAADRMFALARDGRDGEARTQVQVSLQARHLDETSPLRADLREVGEVAQTALDSVRGLSQTLHPSILEELGLASTVDWYLTTVERQLGVRVTYEKGETTVTVPPRVGIQV